MSVSTPTTYQRAWAWLGDNALDELAEIQNVLGTPSMPSTLRAIADRGFSIVVKVQDGQSEENVGVVKRLKEWRRQAGIPARSLMLAGWSQNRYEAVADAEKSNGLIIREELEAFQTSWEFECKGEPGSENWLRMSQFADRILGIGYPAPAEPLKTMALRGGSWIYVQMPNEPRGEYIDWGSVHRLAGRWGPECYPNDAGAQNPSMWPEVAVLTGTRKFLHSYIHPVLGFYGDSPVPASTYIQSLKKAAIIGFTYGYGVYLAFHLTRADWDAFAARNLPAGTAVGALAWTAV